jgi:hypothetical protein
MKIKVETTKTEYTTDIDAAYVWVEIEEKLNLDLNQAQQKMADGSTKVITYAIWVATQTETPYKEWLRDLIKFDVLDDADPKE